MDYQRSIIILLMLYVDIALTEMESSDVRNYLGPRTPYRFRSNKNDSEIKYPGCKDSKIWMIVRHGTRYPSVRDIVEMNSRLPNFQNEIMDNYDNGLLDGELTKDQLKGIVDWSSDLDKNMDMLLTYEGQDEMVMLAERMQKRFPNAIKNDYSNKTFHFRYTATERTQQSARYFTYGLFEKKIAQNILFYPATKVDQVLRFYKHCEKWQKLVKSNPDAYKEYFSYEHSADMNKTLISVSKRLGLNRVLELGIVNLMYKACGYETSWSKHHLSPWCHAFDEESAQVFEYYHDIKHYWVDGYAYNLTSRQACLAIQTMFEMFRSEEETSAKFLFTHSGTILKVLTHMQLYKPESKLTGDCLQKSRPWKTSLIDCFASNLAFVLFKCEDGDHVLTLHQERIIKLPMCDKELCPLKFLEEYFHDSIHDCDFAAMCSLYNTTITW